tara:strand:- start:757 stop:2193 length:1437 start_codon:yes stop_codon:yes gene_type:complete
MDTMTSTDDERSRIPNLMKIGAIPLDTAMDYDTMVLDPVVNTQSFCRFVLDNRGFLNSFSRIQLSVAENSLSAVSAAALLPSGVGIYGLIDRVALRIGTETVSEIVDFQHWMAYKSMFIDSDINLERETYLSSRIMSRRPIMKDDVGSQSNVNGSGWGIGTNKEYNIPSGVDGDLAPQEELINQNFSEFSVSVADLVPWLRFNQLPLYMFGSTQISLEIHFTPKASKGRMITGVLGGGATFDIDTSKTQFIADYIYYDNDLMARFAAENRNMNWTYTDYRLAKRSFTHTALASQQIVPIGGAGRLVNKVISGLQPEFGSAEETILNIYQATCPGISASNNQLCTTNLVYNNNRLYPVDRTSPSVHFHDLISTEQNIPHVSRQEYCRGGTRSGAGLNAGICPGISYNGNVQNAPLGVGLEGVAFWLGYRLNRNERVDSKGIDLQLQYGSLANGQYIHRAYLELVKTASLTPNGFTTGLA